MRGDMKVPFWVFVSSGKPHQNIISVLAPVCYAAVFQVSFHLRYAEEHCPSSD